MRITVMCLACGVVFPSLALAVPPAEDHGQRPSRATIDREVQAIKRETLSISRELSVLEQELLFPPDTRLTVFLSLDSGTALGPALLKLELNRQLLFVHRYSAAERQALYQGGVHKPYVGAISNGDYVLRAQLQGTAGEKNSFEIETTANFTKRKGAKYVELKVSKSSFLRAPKLTVRIW